MPEFMYPHPWQARGSKQPVERGQDHARPPLPAPPRVWEDQGCWCTVACLFPSSLRCKGQLYRRRKRHGPA